MQSLAEEDPGHRRKALAGVLWIPHLGLCQGVSEWILAAFTPEAGHVKRAEHWLEALEASNVGSPGHKRPQKQQPFHLEAPTASA